MLSTEYVAGFFDGEGSVGFERDGRGTGLRLRLQVVNSDDRPLKEMHERWGGSLYRRKTAKPHHTPCWCLSLAGVGAAAMLRDLQPHLVVKKDRVDEALRLFAIQEERKRSVA